MTDSTPTAGSGGCPASLLPLCLGLPEQRHLFGGDSITITLYSGLTVLLGPNGAGKTQAMQAIRRKLQEVLEATTGASARKLRTRFLAAGRMAPFEHCRSVSNAPHGRDQTPAAVGHATYLQQWHNIESFAGDFLALKHRPDLCVKVEARLHALFGSRLRLEWSQQGVQPMFLTRYGEYPANTEASGILHFVGLLAALYNDEVDALLIDEPEISQAA